MNGSNSSSNSPSGVQGICPVGWHIPSKLEWEELISYLGGNGIAGGKMKETGFDYWESPNTGATNSSGFTALGGGGYNDGSFNNLKMKAFWWTTNENGNQARIFDVVNYNAGIGNYDVDKDRKLSVRCIKD